MDHHNEQNYSMAKGSDNVLTTGEGWNSGSGGDKCSYSCHMQYCADLKFDRHHHFIIVFCV